MEQIQEIIFLVAVIGYTVAAAFWDQKYFKIPNKLTLPMFAAGWVYQGVFFQLSGLMDGLLGFLVGFGFLFLLWMVGSAGGGDAKLMGGLSVWLGLAWSWRLLFISVLFIILLTAIVVVWNMMTVGTKQMKKKLLATGKPGTAGERKPETVEQKRSRRLMAYALPIGLATWGMLIMAYTLGVPALPWMIQ